MKKLISALEDLALQIRNMEEYLQTVELPSREAQSLAIDVGIYGGMTVRAMENLRALLASLEEAKEEVKEAIEEEEGGEVPSEPVQEPEDSAPGGEAPVQEPEAKGPKGSKRVRKRKG